MLPRWLLRPLLTGAINAPHINNSSKSANKGPRGRRGPWCNQPLRKKTDAPSYSSTSKLIVIILVFMSLVSVLTYDLLPFKTPVNILAQ